MTMENICYAFWRRVHLYREGEPSAFLQNVDSHLQDHMTSQPA
jgi:hypothetical protein